METNSDLLLSHARQLSETEVALKNNVHGEYSSALS